MASSNVVLRTCFRLQRHAVHNGGRGQAHAAHEPRDAVVEIVTFYVSRGPLNNLAQLITKRTAIFRAQIMFTSERLPAFLDSTALNCKAASSSKIQENFSIEPANGAGAQTTGPSAPTSAVQTTSTCQNCDNKAPYTRQSTHMWSNRVSVGKIKRAKSVCTAEAMLLRVGCTAVRG